MSGSRNTPMSSRMTRKGQVTVPKRVRDALAMRPGARVAFEIKPEGVWLSRADEADIRASLEALSGFGGWDWEGTTEAFMEMTRDEPEA